MPELPDTRIGKIEYCEAHVAPWTTNAVAIGTTTTAVTDFSTKTTAARAAYAAQQAAINAAKAATNNFHIAVRSMATAAQDIIDQVRVKANTSGLGVYSLAQVTPPATPQPMGPLGKPSDFTCELGTTGALKLKWKCTNPRGATGATYQIWRRIGSVGQFEFLVGVGAKKFTDATVPAGSTQVQYQIQAVRSTSVGEFALFIVNFGSDTATPPTVVEATPTSTPTRIAA